MGWEELERGRVGWEEVGSGLERREWVGKEVGVGWKEVGSGLERGRGWVGSQARAGQGRARGRRFLTSRLHLYFSFGFGVLGFRVCGLSFGSKVT